MCWGRQVGRGGGGGCDGMRWGRQVGRGGGAGNRGTRRIVGSGWGGWPRGHRGSRALRERRLVGEGGPVLGRASHRMGSPESGWRCSILLPADQALCALPGVQARTSDGGSGLLRTGSTQGAWGDRCRGVRARAPSPYRMRRRTAVLGPCPGLPSGSLGLLRGPTRTRPLLSLGRAGSWGRLPSLLAYRWSCQSRFLLGDPGRVAGLGGLFSRGGGPPRLPTTQFRHEMAEGGRTPRAILRLDSAPPAVSTVDCHLGAGAVSSAM